MFDPEGKRILFQTVILIQIKFIGGIVRVIQGLKITLASLPDAS